MKLRIRGDSLRFRLTQGEVSKLLAGNRISEPVHFSPSPMDLLVYSLHAHEDTTQITAHFKNGEIFVDLPMFMVKPWANTDQIGIEHAQSTGKGRNLRIVIEKDFRCLQPRPEEDERDNFPHPQQNALQADRCD